MRRYSGTFKDNYQIIVVDTPGFDGTADIMILKKIAEWLEKSYKHGGAMLGGVIYLHDVSLDHLTDKAQRNLEIFQALCGQGALRKVILGTTKWGRISDRRAQAHEDELKHDHWKALIAEGAKVRSFKDKNDAESAWKFIDIVVDNVSKNDFDIDAYFQFQEELGAATDADGAMRAIQKKVLDLRNQVAELEGTTADPERIKKAQEKLSEAEKTLNKLLRQDVESFAQWFRRIFQQVLGELSAKRCSRNSNES
ncbi:hypothetical protein CPB84DRAFT_1686014 [Gymnopilus junonius]|uniref:G domain-containing protein n=1 Tax=Gymnopilus junonius TaxID=109634 RepID=A0A9P5NGL7_GYMJU|nr:hypothetical protein CPB84DRAFT_1686014 [Gymnopilus junonius]